MAGDEGMGQGPAAGAPALIFDPDPERLVLAVEDLGRLRDAGLAQAPAERPSHVFRVLRPTDLVALDVRGFGLRLEPGGDGPALVPDGTTARLEVGLAFQHLGERAYFRSGPPPGPNPGDEPTDPPPIQALAAQASRLVFDVPEGTRIGYSIAGVLQALSRLPLRVAPLATPRAITFDAAAGGTFTTVAALPGGFTLVRHADGLLALAAEPQAPPPAAGVAHVLAQATALRAARTVLAGESAVSLTDRTIARGEGPSAAAGPVTSARAVARGFRDIVTRPPRVTLPGVRPRAPRRDETAIEAPFRVIVSPSREGGFVHAVGPAAAPGDASRVELWHTRLGVRQVDPDDGTVTIAESRHPQRAIRAVWARVKEGVNPDVDVPDGDSPFRMSMTPHERVILVRQTADAAIAPPVPVDVERFYLSALGAFLDLRGRWPDTAPYAVKGLDVREAWDHDAPMGRDQYVRLVKPGCFFPTGHRCALNKVTERKLLEATGPNAYLYQRKFIEVGQPVKTYDDRRMPFRQITITPTVTPDLRDPLQPGTPGALQGEDLFWPAVGTGKFYFTLECIDWNGQVHKLLAPLLFVSSQLPTTAAGKTAADIRAAYVGDPEHVIDAQSRSIAFAAGAVQGDTAFESTALRFDGIPGPAGSRTATPFMVEADVVVPAMRHLAPSAPTTTVKYAAPYLSEGFGGINAEPQVLFELTTPAFMQFGASTEKTGGFVQPDLPVRGLSRVLGTIGDLDDLVNKPADEKFNPQKYLAGVVPKLFGLFDLVDILRAVGLDGAPAFVSEALDTIASLLSDLAALQGVLSSSVTRLAEDAAGAATSKLQQQAADARADLDAIRAQIVPEIDALVAAIQGLLALDAPSSELDVTTAVSGGLGTLATRLAALRTTVQTRALPPQVKAEIERIVNAVQPALTDAAAIADTIGAITGFVNGLDPSGPGFRARFDWQPTLSNFPDVADDKALFIVRPDGFRLSVDARASGQAGVGVDVLAELREFSLNLFPSAPLMRLGFDRLAFRAASGRKPEVDVVFRGIEFVGVLSFIETLKDLIPFDAFSDPPYLDVSADGVTAGFTVGLPSVAVGVFSLENISLGADARVPFLGNEALTIGFNFCSREKPFRLTVMLIGGGGFVGIRLSPRGLVVLEMALEAGANLSIDLGVASGSVSIMVGVYLRLEADAGSLTGYFRIRGEVDVLGLISASITLELSLTYEFDTGKLVGRASLEIEVEVFFFSFSVTVSCERRLAGSNGDPTFEQVMGLLPDGTSPAWSSYCAAFAEA
ncbi:MAG: hypothetical protein R2745_01200 [Vicinamibacterales bacterium]